MLPWWLYKLYVLGFQVPPHYTHLSLSWQLAFAMATPPVKNVAIIGVCYSPISSKEKATRKTE